MPHSVTPETTPADDTPRTISQVDAIKPEPDTQDVAMEDAPTPPPAPVAEKAKVNLEELFDDEDSDEEFPSSAPVVKEEELSQPAPMYVQHAARGPWEQTATDSVQQDNFQIHLLRPRNNARLLPTPLPLPPTLPMAQSLRYPLSTFRASRIRLHPSQRCLPALSILSYGRSSPETMHPNAAIAIRDWTNVLHESEGQEDVTESQCIQTADEGAGLRYRYDGL